MDLQGGDNSESGKRTTTATRGELDEVVGAGVGDETEVQDSDPDRTGDTSTQNHAQNALNGDLGTGTDRGDPDDHRDRKNPHQAGGPNGGSNANYLAVAVGFEPTEELPPHTLSRRAP